MCEWCLFVSTLRHGRGPGKTPPQELACIFFSPLGPAPRCRPDQSALQIYNLKYSQIHRNPSESDIKFNEVEISYMHILVYIYTYHVVGGVRDRSESNFFHKL